MNKKLHQANKEKYDALMRVNLNTIRFQPLNFFLLKFPEPQTKEMFIKSNNSHSGEVLREIRNCMFDSQYEIQSMIATEAFRIKAINDSRKKAASHQLKQMYLS